LNILALETSTDACSVALRLADGVIFSEFEIVPRQHTYYLPRMMDAVLHLGGIKKASIDAIAYANGPGAFTGVRIATASAQGLAIGLGIPLLPVSTLAVVAQQASDEFGIERMQVALDARMGEAYTALYAKHQTTERVQLEGGEHLVKLEQLADRPAYCSIGSGFYARRAAAEGAESERTMYEAVYPTASALVKLAASMRSEQDQRHADTATINYLRNKVAEKKKNL
jgi:tRNA threonylcarbamoyladenosine biosynthesis protein TsaB